MYRAGVRQPFAALANAAEWLAAYWLYSHLPLCLLSTAPPANSLLPQLQSPLVRRSACVGLSSKLICTAESVCSASLSAQLSSFLLLAGKATAIGTRTAQKPQLEAQLAPKSQGAASQPDASGNAAESSQHTNSQQDAEWLASTSAHHAQTVCQDRQLPQRKKRLRTTKHSNGEEPELLEETATLHQDADDNDSKGNNQGLSDQQHQASTAVHAVPGRGHHKQQVIEDDDIMLGEEGAGGTALAPGAMDHGALDLDGQGAGARAAKGCAKKASGLAAVDDGSNSALTSRHRHESTPKAPQRARPAVGLSLLDAMMDDDNFGFGAPTSRAESQGDQPSQVTHASAGRIGDNSNVEQQPPLPQAQQTVAGQLDLSKQDPDLHRTDVLPNAPGPTAEQHLHQAPSSAPRKGTLRDKMRALGMKV